ncbi:hypothetical protein AMJ39_08170 [candidate division TA06 bacterium DG_24]|uniref:DUF4145 domain-containing protein n=2 Tax=Bacteria division TA06 TaxID=1156500 RepID=A0A0S8G4G5_UNCT6|nr:MAG: hypothetical protein AMJ39_08170 [candidate division TA06 bacterium DG_24]KPK67839.1 MAG: hypothetical protein AMJ82_09720 [candidate division TA06 bacterium SM23_40]
MTEWKNLSTLSPRKFTCSYCGSHVRSDRGYLTGTPSRHIRICPNCNNPTYFEGDRQTPAPPLGNRVSNVPAEIDSLYNEARACAAARAYTAAVLACRKLITIIAVEQGALKGKSFLECVEFLADRNFIPPNGRIWLHYIRTRGSEAAHDLSLMTEDDANNLITFAEMLLRFIYEFPARVTSSPPSFFAADHPPRRPVPVGDRPHSDATGH